MKYTTAHRMFTPSVAQLDLATGLDQAGFRDIADQVRRIARVGAEADMWVEAAATVESKLWDVGRDEAIRVRDCCISAAHRALTREGFQEAGYEPAAELYHAAFLALVHAGTIVDGARLSRAAIGVLDGDPLDCADVVRQQGRFRLLYELDRLRGPDTGTAPAARRAAEAMAAASRVPIQTDGDWFEAAGLMVSVVWHGSVAGGLPPLDGWPLFEEFLRSDMGGTLPS